MWQHAEAYNAIITHSVHRLDMAPAELSWHVIWLHHLGMIELDNGRPVRRRQAQII